MDFLIYTTILLCLLCAGWFVDSRSVLLKSLRKGHRKARQYGQADSDRQQGLPNEEAENFQFGATAQWKAKLAYYAAIVTVTLSLIIFSIWSIIQSVSFLDAFSA
ncbi:hypothetical protein FXN63_04215 [Pigmentiphaga aceris]|uniref:Uncharacterized protein n=1 Tax=Pigmentiphaga aceris TaxID=1940612 RepID=A0A5C0ASE8_9BURK|nr:hypothetical protein [Pigmentiphaga aceris]QEI05128.1 hypothetical protein FXN63_04215 [Pigmentiphaga aceris]